MHLHRHVSEVVIDYILMDRVFMRWIQYNFVHMQWKAFAKHDCRLKRDKKGKVKRTGRAVHVIEMNENLAQLEIEWICFDDGKNSLRNASSKHTHTQTHTSNHTFRNCKVSWHVEKTCAIHPMLNNCNHNYLNQSTVNWKPIEKCIQQQ